MYVNTLYVPSPSEKCVAETPAHNKPALKNKSNRSQKIIAIALPVFFVLLTLGISTSVGFGIAAGSGAAIGAGIGIAVAFPVAVGLYFALKAIFKSKQPISPVPRENSFPDSFQEKMILKNSAPLYRPLVETPPSDCADRASLPPIPENFVAPGIPNMQKGIYNICWLNSIIKLLATTHFYDHILLVDVRTLKATPKQKARLAELQVALKEIIIALRTGKPGTVLDAKYPRKVVKALQKIAPRENYGRDQLDSAEFHRNLQSWFDFPKPRRGVDDKCYPFFMNVYQADTPHKFAAKNIKIERSGMITLTIPMQELKTKNPLNISTAYMGVDKIKVREDLLLTDEASEDIYDSEGLPFTYAKVLINAPEELFININRNSFDVETGNVAKCKRPLLFGKNQTILFKKFEKTFQICDNNKVYLTQRSQVVYQVKGGSVHIGGSSNGHYVYVERKNRGKFLYHSDSTVKEISSKEAEMLLKQATILHLRKLEETVGNRKEEDDHILLESLLPPDPLKKNNLCYII